MITQTAAKIALLNLTFLMLGMVSACSSQPVAETARSPSASPVRQPENLRSKTVGERAAEVALRQVGVPYRYGGNSVSGFDCSGLVHYSYSRAGKRVPRTTGQLWSSTAPVDRSRLQAGDLLFFSIEGKMSHVGLYLGGERFVHAPSSGRSVRVEDLRAPFYASALIRAGRFN